MIIFRCHPLILSGRASDRTLLIYVALGNQYISLKPGSKFLILIPSSFSTDFQRQEEFSHFYGFSNIFYPPQGQSGRQRDDDAEITVQIPRALRTHEMLFHIAFLES